ncbi:hypothetical protein CEUSTIGMA_g12446.t1 [Chlamydomonas eustigma]|uniref:CHASE domain-containing protein n=1 Tax=Chlamydomonas eustigma TaxID=1157962 RepID=A0A250XPQ5_9CHLO|nr:hypothetical protein CEUSTIGMA_g12446.t1 [Chlamydomonas eustigma]|eukprot:GAX85026.1 hypothetical protein CEUSTIGMA_g12446.t1 [Chlamydomonas eustigma]
MAAQLTMWFGNIRGNVRNKPSILIMPIAVFIGCVLGSILGTYYAALSQESNAKTTAQSLAVSVISTFQQRFESTLAPIVAINGIIKLNPNYTQLEPYLTEFISSQLIPLSSSSSSSASSSPSFQYIEVDPMLIGGIQLPTTFNGQPAPWLRNRNLDFLSVPLVLKRWPKVMSNWPNNTMFGPSPLVAGGIGVAVDVAVFRV